MNHMVPSGYEFGGWTVDVGSRSVHRDDTSVVLDPTAMAVLAYLLSRAGETVGTDEILDFVWSKRLVERSAVARNVNQIRSALGDDARQPTYIKTVPKRGYRTVAPVSRAYRRNVPQIGIVPLENLSTDPQYAYLAAAVTEDITTLLGQIHREQRIMRLESTDQAAGTSYVLTGSVRKFATRVRVAVQLNQPKTGLQIWSERYDREFADLFALQDELVGDIVHAVGWATWRAVDTTLRHERPENLDVWSLLHQSQMIHFDRRTHAKEKLRLVETALRLDPDYAYAHSTMAWSLVGLLTSRLSDDDARDQRRALDHATMALSLAPDDPAVMNHCILVHRTFGDLNLALALSERVMSLPGTDPHDYWGLLIMLGRALEVVVQARKRWRNAMIHQCSLVSIACSVEGLREEALETALRAVTNFPKSLVGWVQLANAQGSLGQLTEGQGTLEQVYSRSPNWSVAYYEECMRWHWRHDSRLIAATTNGLHWLQAQA